MTIQVSTAFIPKLDELKQLMCNKLGCSSSIISRSKAVEFAIELTLNEMKRKKLRVSAGGEEKE